MDYWKIRQAVPGLSSLTINARRRTNEGCVPMLVTSALFDL
jgi:hypothetical protein